MIEKIKQIICEERSWPKIWSRVREEFKDVPEKELRDLVREAKTQLAEEADTKLRAVVIKKDVEKIAEAMENERSLIQNDVQSLGQSELDTTTKRGILETLLRKCADRIRLLETLQQESLQQGAPLDARIEQCLLAYMKETREIVESYLNLSEELREEEAGFVVKTISQMTQRLLFVIAQTLKEVFGESDPRIEVFKQKLKERLPRIADE